MAATFTPAGAHEMRNGGTVPVPPLANFLNNQPDYSVPSYRAQRLTHLFGLSAPTARLIASLVWEGAHYG